jgi:small GTP-binding protein
MSLISGPYHGDSAEAKVVLLGSATAGKTSLVTRLTVNGFDRSGSPTIGAAKTTEVIRVDGISVHLQIWDTAGSERYRALAPLYYRNAHGAILVYDMTSPDSFRDLESWHAALAGQAGPKPVIMVAGTKCDLEAKRAVPQNDGKELAERYGAYGFRETSSLTGENVHELFTDMARGIISGQWRAAGDAAVVVMQPKRGCCG